MRADRPICCKLSVIGLADTALSGLTATAAGSTGPGQTKKKALDRTPHAALIQGTSRNAKLALPVGVAAKARGVFRRTAQRTTFVHSFLKLSLRIAVPDDTAARLNIQGFVFDQCGS